VEVKMNSAFDGAGLTHVIPRFTGSLSAS